MRTTIMVILLCLCAISAVASQFLFANPALAYDVHITVGGGEDGEDGPLVGASITLKGPVGRENFNQTKKADDEGAAHFSVENTGYYQVSIVADGYETKEERILVKADQEPQFFLQLLEKAKANKARLVVSVKDKTSGWPLEGVSVKVTRADEMVGDHMATGQDGKAVVLINTNDASKGLEFEVLVMKNGYEPEVQTIRVQKGVLKDYPVNFALEPAEGLRLVRLTLLEDGPRNKIMSARVVLDGGKNKFYTGSSNPDGQVLLQVAPNTKYEVKVTTSLYDGYEDTIDLTADKSNNVIDRTYLLVRKDSAPQIRRALIVYVRGKDEKGVITPLKGVAVTAPGYNSGATDAEGRMVFLHTVPPGEMINVSVRTPMYKPGAATVLVKDKGVMIDVNAFAKAVNRGMSEMEALRSQRVTAYDTVTITLDEEKIRPVKEVVGKINAPAEVDPDKEIPYQVELNFVEGDGDVVTIEETIVILDSAGNIIQRAGNIRTLNVGEPSTESYAFTPPKPGTYRIRANVKWEKGELWKGEHTVKVSENREKIEVTGNVVAKAGLVKLDQRVQVAVTVLYKGGPTLTLDTQEVVELFDPKGEVVQNNFAARKLNRGSISERVFNIVCQAPGWYRLRSTIKGPDGAVLWTGEDKFQVSGGSAVGTKPGPGYWKLKTKTVGHVPPTFENGNIRVGGSISETSFTYFFEYKPPYEAKVQLSLNFSTPPTVLKPGEIIELTCSGSGSVTGKDAGSTGTGGSWDVQGSGTIIEQTKVFVGRGSDGKDYSSANGRAKIKIGSSGALKIILVQVGPVWGNTAANWNPCMYEYEWMPGVAAPSSNLAKPTLTGTPPINKAPAVGGTYTDRQAMASNGKIYYVTLYLKESKTPGVYSVLGHARPAEGAGPRIEITGTYRSSTKVLKGAGAFVPAIKGSTVKTDATLMQDFTIFGQVIAKSPKESIGVKFTVKKE